MPRFFLRYRKESAIPFCNGDWEKNPILVITRWKEHTPIDTLISR
jgi:hypothetical protein